MCWGTLFTSEQCLWGHFVGGHCTLWHRISARDTYNFSSYENWLACSWKQLLLLVLLLKRSTNKSSCRVPTLTRSSDRYWNGMGVTAMFECMTQLGFTIDMWPHSEIWLELSGSRSNNLNSLSCQAIFPMTCAFLQVGVVVALVEKGRWVWRTWFGVEEGEEERCCLWGTSHMRQSLFMRCSWHFSHEEQED